jgi:hypothetical protein
LNHFLKRRYNFRETKKSEDKLNEFVFFMIAPQSWECEAPASLWNFVEAGKTAFAAA